MSSHWKLSIKTFSSSFELFVLLVLDVLILIISSIIETRWSEVTLLWKGIKCLLWREIRLLRRRVKFSVDGALNRKYFTSKL